MGDCVTLPPAMSTQEVHSAIQSLYGQNGGAAQQAANQFLVQFASTDGAWEVALGLLGVNDPAVQYFGANMLYGKIRSDWSTLPEPHQGPFMDAMGNHLTKLASRPGSNLAARRLCLTMAAAATRVGPSAAYGLVDKIIDKDSQAIDQVLSTDGWDNQAGLVKQERRAPPGGAR